MDSAGTGYVYANDDPVNAVDPSGKFSFTFGCAAALLTTIRLLIPDLQAIGLGAVGWYYFSAFVSVFIPPLGIALAIVGLIVAATLAIASVIVSYEAVAAACGLPAIP